MPSDRPETTRWRLRAHGTTIIGIVAGLAFGAVFYSYLTSNGWPWLYVCPELPDGRCASGGNGLVLLVPFFGILLMAVIAKDIWEWFDDRR